MEQPSSAVGEQEEKASKLLELVHNEVEHQIKHVVTSPLIIDRSVGEAMRHIGSALNIQSTLYLPIRNEEILVEPQQLPSSFDAVVLMSRTFISANSFQVMGERGTEESGKIIYRLVAFKPNDFDMRKTEFQILKQEIGEEIIRQLNLLLSADGCVLLHCVILQNYFQKPAEMAEPAMKSAPSAIEPTEGQRSLLPQVDHDLL